MADMIRPEVLEKAGELHDEGDIAGACEVIPVFRADQRLNQDVTGSGFMPPVSDLDGSGSFPTIGEMLQHGRATMEPELDKCAEVREIHVKPRGAREILFSLTSDAAPEKARATGKTHRTSLCRRELCQRNTGNGHAWHAPHYFRQPSRMVWHMQMAIPVSSRHPAMKISAARMRI